MAASSRPFLNPLRLSAWSGAALLILAPLIAMRFTSQVNWTGRDFAFAVALVGGVGLAYELAIRVSHNLAYRIGMAVALGSAFLLVWGNLAVGVIGSEDNPANLIFFAVPVIGFICAVVGRFERRGMMVAMVITAASQVAAATIAFAEGWGFTGPITVVFTSLWLIAAALFRKAIVPKA